MADRIRKALILSARQGSRLMPHTSSKPKCLVEIEGHPMLSWQVAALRAAGIAEIVVVAGFGAERVEALAASYCCSTLCVRTIVNPFYAVADNLGSVWLALAELDEDLVVLNGDTLVTPEHLNRVIDADNQSVTVTVDRKDVYDLDDMKVAEQDGRLTRIGKRLNAEACTCESIGLLAMRGAGREAFQAAVERVMRSDCGIRCWYLQAVDEIAATERVLTRSIAGLPWAEVDFPQDLELAGKLAQLWIGEPWAPRKALAAQPQRPADLGFAQFDAWSGLATAVT